MSTPTTSPGGTGEVQVDVESLDAYLREVLIPLSERAHGVANNFGSIPLDTELFGPIPHAKQLAERHRWGHEVYGPTLSALANDVDTLIDKLGKVIQTYRDHDDQVAGALAKLGASLSGEGGYTSASTWERERAEHGGAPGSLAPPTGSTGAGVTHVSTDTLPTVAAASTAEPAKPEPPADTSPPPAASSPAEANKSAEPKPSGTNELT